MSRSFDLGAKALRQAIESDAPPGPGMEAVIRALPASAQAFSGLDWGGDAQRGVRAVVEALDDEALPAGAEELWLRLRLELWHDRVDGCALHVLAGAESASYSSPLAHELWSVPQSLDVPCATRVAQLAEESTREILLVSFAALLAAELFERIDERLLPGQTGGLGITAGFELGSGVHLGFHDGTEFDTSHWQAFQNEP